MRVACLFLLLLISISGFTADRRLEKLNRAMHGRIVDHTNNHGCDFRQYSSVLCEKRDLYVYLPPCYDPSKKYSLIVWFHGAFGDEQGILTGHGIKEYDEMVANGCAEPAIIALPDGTYCGTNQITSQHSFWINGRGGNFEDHLFIDVIPFVLKNYPIKDGRQHHAIGGLSAGGFGAVSIGLKHRDYFSATAALSAPVNMRYNTVSGRYFKNFDPCTYCWREEYKPNQIVGRYLMIPLRAKNLLEPVFGPREIVMNRILTENPADLLATTNLQPGELKIHLHAAGWDNFNFDAQSESFVWLAKCRNVNVEYHKDNKAKHMVGYFKRNMGHAFKWLAEQVSESSSPKHEHDHICDCGLPHIR